MSYFLLVGIGGALGATTRYLIDQISVSHLGSSIAGTFIVNISGSFILGLLIGFLSSHTAWPEEIKVFLSVGFISSFTTFSTLSVATIQMFEKGDMSGAAVNLIGSIIVGLLAAVSGILLGRII